MLEQEEKAEKRKKRKKKGIRGKGRKTEAQFFILPVLKLHAGTS
jgi:hypothetical protein